MTRSLWISHSLWICVALLLHSCDAVCAPSNNTELKDAVNACLGESGTGNCANFAAASNGAGCNNGGVNGVIGLWDVSQVTDMRDMFAYATAFNQTLDWNTSQVTEMGAMFGGAMAFNQPIILDTSQVTDMSYMFQDARAFNGDISQWNTANVIDMEGMFYKATDFNGDISNWNTTSVTATASMFYDATAFNGDISKWDTSKVTTMESMFEEALLFNGDISKWDMSSVMFIAKMFFNSGFTRTLCGGAWDTLKSEWTDTLGTSTARYGCCPAGSFMSNPFVAFSEANSCSLCTAGIFGTDVLNDETTCTNCPNLEGCQNLVQNTPTALKAAYQQHSDTCN